MPLSNYLSAEIALRFDGAVARVLPTFQARPIRWSGEARKWCSTADASLQFILWVEWRRPAHGFTVDIGWSSGGAMPKKASMFASTGPDAAQHRFALPELWSPGQPGAGWSCCSSDADIPTRATQWSFGASRQSERSYRILEAGLLNVDHAVEDAIEKLLGYGVPFFRRVAAAHGMGAVEIERVLPLVAELRPVPATEAATASARVACLRAAGQTVSGPSIPREVWATTVAVASETRWALRGYTGLRSRFRSDVPHFWRVPTMLTGTEVMAFAFVACLVVAAVEGPAWLTPVLLVGLVLSGLANPWIRYKRRLKWISRRACTARKFLEELGHLIPNFPAEEIAVAVRRAYALALDLPIDVVQPDNRMPGFRLGDCPPMLHEFAIYLSEALPSKPDPFILGNLLARHKRRAGILDFIEATETAMQDIGRVEPCGRAGK